MLNDAGVPCGPIYAMDQVFADPQVQHLGIAREVDASATRPRAAGGPAGAPVAGGRALRSAAPDAGQHSAEILAELGYDAAAIEELRRGGVI